MEDDATQAAAFLLLREYGVSEMPFKIVGTIGDRKSTLRFGPAAVGAAHVEVIIDDERIGRLHASRLLRMMADRLLECDWPPQVHCEASVPTAG
jgi:hypothetical protein